MVLNFWRSLLGSFNVKKLFERVIGVARQYHYLNLRVILTYLILSIIRIFLRTIIMNVATWQLSIHQKKLLPWILSFPSSETFNQFTVGWFLWTFLFPSMIHLSFTTSHFHSYKIFSKIHCALRLIAIYFTNFD